MADKTKALAQCAAGIPLEEVRGLLALRDFRAVDSLPTVLQLLSSTDSRVRAAAAEAAGAIAGGGGHAGTVGAAIMPLLGDQDSQVRQEAITALARLAYAPAFGAFETLLRDDENPLVRVTAAESLGDVGASSSVQSLLVSVGEDDDETVRAFAANSLGLVGNAEIVDALKEALSVEASESVRASLHCALYRLGESAHLAALVQQMSNANEDLGMVILNTLLDLVTRRMPPRFRVDWRALVAPLRDLARHQQLLAGTVERLLARLYGLAIDEEKGDP